MHICRGLAGEDDALQKLSGHPECCLGFGDPRRAATERRGLDLRHCKAYFLVSHLPKSLPRCGQNRDLDCHTSCQLCLQMLHMCLRPACITPSIRLGSLRTPLHCLTAGSSYSCCTVHDTRCRHPTTPRSSLIYHPVCWHMLLAELSCTFACYLFHSSGMSTFC